MENSGKVIGALLLGAAVGAAVGVLLAPDKGSETRKKLFSGAKDLADNLQAKVKDGINTFKEGAENLQGVAEDKADDFKKGAKSKMDQYQAVADKAKAGMV